MNTERAKNELETILSQEEYQIYYEDNRNTLQLLWDRARNWIADRLNDLFLNFTASTALANGVLLVLIGAAILLLAVFVYRLTRGKRRKHNFRNKKPLHSSSERNWSFADHLEEADRQENIEAYKPAVRHLFLALLLYFDEKEWLEARIWKTNGEYYEELRRSYPEIADRFFKLAMVFDHVTYGDRLITKEEYGIYREQTLKWIEQSSQQEALIGKEGRDRG